MGTSVRLALLGIILATCCWAQPPVAVDKGAVSGTVTNTAGEPLRRVSLQLTPVSRVRGSAADEPLSNLASETDLQGNFIFDVVVPGRYLLAAQRSGYLNASFYNARGGVLTVEPSQKVTGLVIKMTPQGIIGGRVIDDENEPVSGATVKVTPGKVPDLVGAVPPAGDGTTNADGAFAIGGLPPGRYVVSVAVPSATVVSPRSHREIYVTTYYPDAIDVAAATPIEVGPGAQVRGLEIRLHKVPVFRVSGKLVNAVTGEPGSAILSLFRRGSVPGLSAKSTGVGAGDFVFDGVSPGAYVLEAKSTGEAEDRPSLVAWQIISVGGGDLDRVVVEMRPGIGLRGSVINEGALPSSWPQITLTPEESLNYPTDLPVIDANGRFTAAGLEPGRYRVNIAGMAPPMFVKTVRFNGRDIHEPIDLASAATAFLEIVISDRASSISGAVSDVMGPVGAGITVMLTGKTRGAIRIMQTDDSGRFSFAGLPPGEYILTATDSGPGFPRMPPDLLERVGKTVTLGEGVSATVDVQLTTMDDTQLNVR